MAFAGRNIWNEIPKEIRMAQTLHSFKEHLKNILPNSRHSHHDSLIRSPYRCVGDLHPLGSSPQSRWMGMLPGRYGFQISPDSLVNWIDAFLWWGLGLGWCSVGLLGLRSCWHVWLFGHSVGGLFDCTQEKQISGSPCLFEGMNDGFDCCGGILIILLFSFFLFYFENSSIVSR